MAENMSNSEEADDDDEVFILHPKLKCTVCDFDLNSNRNAYKIVPHPVLKEVAVCILCYDQVSEKLTDDENKSNIDTEINEETDICDWCVGCVDHPDCETLYLCDTEGCKYCYCRNCIQRNLGDEYLNELLQAESDTPWYCFMCQPYPALTKLHDAMTIGMENSIYRDSYFESTSTEVDPNTVLTEEQILKEFDILTLMVDEEDTAARKLKDTALARKRIQIQQELAE